MKTEIINAVKELAQRNYSKGYGWQVWIECYSDKEIEETLGHHKTVAAALKDATRTAKLWSQQEREACNEIF